MARLAFTILSLVLTLGHPAAAQEEWSYPFRGESVTLVRDPGHVAVFLSPILEGAPEITDLERIRNLATEIPGLGVATTSDQPGYVGLWLLSLTSPPTSPQRRGDEIMAALGARAEVAWAAPVLSYRDTMVIPKPEILLSLEEHAPVDFLASLRDEHGLTEARSFPGSTSTTLLTTHGTPTDAWILAARLRQRPEVRAAQVNCVLRLAPHAVPDDPLFVDQAGLWNTGQSGGTPGADVHAIPAWDVTTGSDAIVIAILDEGVDVDHPDLAPNIVAGYDATDQPSPEGIPGNPSDNDPHGTACAGIAAAAGNNGLGLAGVSWTSKIMPVRLGYGGHWTEQAWIVDAITWATDNGADIISNSWGGSIPSVFEQDAIVYALSAGRSGLGAPVLFSSGNANGPVDYPAAYPETIAVGATSPCDERKSPISCDNQNWWGSNFGPELTLVAPGPLTVTTDIAGPEGYSPEDYVLTFGGTSASCPFVAGAAALVLSLAPELTASEVQDLLELSAEDQVGIPGEDTPGWDVFMGHGRLNLDLLMSLTLEVIAPLFLRGDVDLTQTINLADALGILNHLFLDGDLGCRDAADFDDSGTLGLPDAIATLDFLFSSGPPPAPPYPSAGVDPTDDALDCVQGL